MSTIRLDRRLQGPTDRGQGGWAAQRFQQLVGEPVTVSLRAAVPLETDLTIIDGDGGWSLVDATGPSLVTIMTARPGAGVPPGTDPVSLDQAREGRNRFEFPGADHPVPYCFSCGLHHDSMRVHAGPLDDGRYATDWTVPDWAIDDRGQVDDGVLWAAVDCTAAWYVCASQGYRMAFTVELSVEQLHPLEPGLTYALVGWNGDEPTEWDGRKRHGASAAFAPDGTLVARSRSFWVAAR